jgi:hypothetical protein
VDLQAAFLNCGNLFEPGQCPDRSALDGPGLTSKVAGLAASLRRAAGGAVPHVCGLCEVGSERLARQVAERLDAGRFRCLWSGTPPRAARAAETGLAAVYDPSALSLAAGADAVVIDPGATPARPRWMAARFQLLGGSRAVFWFVVNHWKSRLGRPRDSEADRLTSARALGEFVQRVEPSTTPLFLLLGDFNCEPFERPFAQTGSPLRAVRERALVQRDRNRLAYFYNPMWRFLPEPAEWDAERPAPATPSRLLGTWCDWESGTQWLVLDQILVSRRLLDSSSLALREPSIRVVEPVAACSDHCAIGACLRY